MEIQENTPESSEEQDNDGDIPEGDSRIEHVKLAQEFIKLIQNATLDNGKMDSDATGCLRFPSQETEDLSDPDLRFSLDLYMSCIDASEATYNNVCDALRRRFPAIKILSHYHAKKMLSDLSGVVTVADDMCINSCHAYTGPFLDRDTCAVCSEPRYTTVTTGASERRVPRQQMTTISLGPQIQALRRSLHGANAMRYREQRIKDFRAASLNLKDADLDSIYTDIFCGSDVLELSEALGLTSDDTTVIFSIDGAQLYQNKKSDTWIAIWVVADYDPKTQYQLKHVLPAVIVPRPNKPKNIDSFLFRCFHHLSAIQQEDHGTGIKVYNAVKKEVVLSRTCVLCATADAVGLIEIDGRVGHHGRHGCRKGCDFQGRHKPNNYLVEDCNHPDFDFRGFEQQLSPEKYRAKLAIVVNSATEAEYERNHRDTGISKPSILSGLLVSHILEIPLCYTLNSMHLFDLNLTDLLISLWRGSIPCEATDNKHTWDWAVFMNNNVWQAHGQLVAEATKYFPSSFHRPPRNPAEKISSGYKATEYFLYVFGLGPGFFRAAFPRKYWLSFCKVVCAIRIIIQHTITGRQAQEAHSYFVQFVEEFENIYYQRHVDRLHFAWPCLHSLLHAAHKLYRVGNGVHTDHFTMERVIGELGKNVQQPSNPFGALAKLTLRKAQTNALKSIYPELDDTLVPKIPKYAHDLGNGNILLRPRKRTASEFSDIECEAISAFCVVKKRQKWGRFMLLNGQIARSSYAENKCRAENKRNTRNIKVSTVHN